MNSYNLLLCSVDFIVHDLRRSESRIHFLNTEFLHSIPNDDDAAVLETLCRQFEGVVLDAKHFRTHWWLPRLSRLRSEHILLINPDFTSFLENIGINMTNIHKLYEEEITKRGEMDERMFIPADISTVFDEAFDASAVEQLRRSELDETWVFDAELLLRMSAQSCLERLNEQKQQATPLSCKSYVISGDQFCPVSPISASLYNVSKLDDLLRNDWDFNDSELDRIMLQWRDNPKEFIVNCVRNMGDELERKVASEREAQDGFDKTFTQMIKARRSSTDALFYRLLEKVVIAERLRSACMEVPDLSSVLHKEELIASIYACCLELVIFTYSSERTFPWSIELLKLAPIHFYKVIELIIRAEPELSREMVKHLNKVEERVLEELSWAIDSPLWSTLARRPDGVPSSQSVSLSTMESYSQRAHNTIGLSQRFTASPMKMPHSAITVTNAAKRRLEFEEDEAGPAKRIAVESDWTTGACSSSTLLFFRKVYFLAAVRLQDLCERVRLDEKGRQRVWTLFEHILRTETSLMAGRHLDQNLMCCIYVVSKIGKQDISFHDIMHHYRHQPQASSRIYRRVLIDQAISPSVMSDDNASRDSIGSCSGGKLRSGSALPVPGMGSAPPTPEPQNLDYTDLIKYYNRVFVSRVEYFAKKLQPSLIDLKENGISLLSMPLVRCHTLSPRRLIADHVSVLPMSSIPASPVRPLRYSFNRSPSKDLKTINAVVGAAIRPLSYTISPCQATTYRHQHFAARSLS
ncbi:hypothetical protein AB6A40_002619 [Gnathostoma spinigerum]|uniref:Retinoblastoma-associated protein A-box domain-containing protein n=1 Tax=Gnathostoma spinigerum TaxID=75299 RepID=A0ABD6E898_9BILA